MSLFRNLVSPRIAPLVWALALAILWIPATAVGNTSPVSASLAWDPNPESGVAGYKIYWGQASRVYTGVLDTGSTPHAVLTNLNAGTLYYCAVTAYNGAGQESSFSQEITLSFGVAPQEPDTSGRLVLLEAESGQLGSPMAVFTGPSESWVDSTTFSQTGWTQLTFEAPVSGNYHVWCRVKAPAESSDSFFVTMDGGAEEVFHVYGTPTPPDGTRTSDWVWRRFHLADSGPRVYSLSQASHTLRFRVREQGTLLDRIVLSSDPAFVPTDALPRSGSALAVTGISASQSLAPGAGTTLAVTAAATGPVTYQWFKNGSAIPNATAPGLVLEALETSDSGSYSVTLASGSATTNAGPVLLTVGESVAPPRFEITRFTVNPDRSVSFQVDGELSANVLVYASSDLVNWNLIGGQLNETGVIAISDPAAVGATRRFYRLVSEAAAVQQTGDGDPDAVPQGSPTKELYVNPGL